MSLPAVNKYALLVSPLIACAAVKCLPVLGNISVIHSVAITAFLCYFNNRCLEMYKNDCQNVMKNHPNLRHTFQQVRNHALAVAVAYPLSMLAVKVGIAASAVTHGGVVTLAASSLLTRLAIEWLVKDRQLIAEPLPTHLCPEGSRRIIPSVEEVT